MYGSFEVSGIGGVPAREVSQREELSHCINVAKQKQYCSVVIKVCASVFLICIVVVALSVNGNESSNGFGAVPEAMSSWKTRNDGAQLLLLRHAKSSWDGPAGISDFDRELAQRGLDEAAAIGSFLRKRRVPPPLLIVASPSCRTRQTLDLVMANWMPEWTVNSTLIPVVWDMRLYAEAFSDPADESVDWGYPHILRSLDTSLSRVLVVGHDPSVGQLAVDLVKRDDKAAVPLRKGFPPGSFAELSWSQKVVSRCNMRKHLTTGGGDSDSSRQGGSPLSSTGGGVHAVWRCIADNPADVSLFVCPNDITH